ncbi:MAG: acyl-CoA thioesterase [Burkholderiaceae bacterium]
MSTTTQRPQPQTRDSYPVYREIATRWMDNDVYGHINNVIYYSWFDTAVNAHLIENGALNIYQGEIIGLVVETHCNYFSSLSFPQIIEAGIRVAKMGTSSVRYEIGLFAKDENISAANGHFIHVYVNRDDRKPVSQLPIALKQVLEKLK